MFKQKDVNDLLQKIQQVNNNYLTQKLHYFAFVRMVIVCTNILFLWRNNSFVYIIGNSTTSKK